MANDTFDYIVVGAGSAGCVLANRLSADPGVSVLLLEAGGKNKSPLVTMPAGVGALIFSENAQNWGFWTEPEPQLNDRRIWWPRGRGLGGSSAINGMIYTRGHPIDYDEWGQLGLSGWSWNDVLPYFKKLENHHGGGSEHHGGDGPLTVSRGESDSPFHDAFIAAGREAGYPVTDDFNGQQQEGFGRYDLTIRDGKRWSTAKAYLEPILNRPNLTCITLARLETLILDKGRVTGVRYAVGKAGEKRTANARCEVILSAGAVQSPHLLQLSGIGPSAALKSVGIEPRHDLPGVGQNLQDHLDVVLTWQSKDLKTVYSHTKGIGRLAVAARYLLTGKGIGRQQFLESGAYVKSAPHLDRPDLQLHAVLTILPAPMAEPMQADGFSVHVCLLRPQSRGTVLAASANPSDYPRIQANYLDNPQDLDALRQGVRLVQSVVNGAALDGFRADPVEPPKGTETDDDIDAWIQRWSETLYHPVGTCKMGRADDPTAVVDDRLRVRGLRGLRVVDASVMPLLVGANTNAATIMIAEKASDMILADRRQNTLEPA